MNPSITVRQILNTLYGYTTDKIIDLDFATVAISETDSSNFWNWALVDDLIDSKKLLEIEDKLKQYDRQLAIYCPQDNDLELLYQFLKSQGLEKTAQDCYLFYDQEKVSDLDFSKIKIVDSEKDLEIFLTTADQCYQVNDPQNVYGQLGEFLKTIKRAWHNLHHHGKIELYLAYEQEKPVAVSMLSPDQKVSYISTVGSLPSIRGQGFGKLVTLYAVKKSIAKGCQQCCLVTESHTYPHEFYQRIGFSNKFQMNIYA